MAIEEDKLSDMDDAIVEESDDDDGLGEFQIMSSAYNSLDPRVRKWVYKQGWSSLRPLQESSIPAILARDRDVLISAGTAAGKTEAFFLPACSAIADPLVDLALSISVH